jgi:hypothetical protein
LEYRSSCYHVYKLSAVVGTAGLVASRDKCKGEEATPAAPSDLEEYLFIVTLMKGNKEVATAKRIFLGE